MTALRLIALTLGAFTTACASAGSVTHESALASHGAPHWSRAASAQPILATELNATSATTAYDAVLRLRPRFFLPTHSLSHDGTAVQPSVVVERGFPEPLDVLKQIASSAIAEIDFVDHDQAEVLYGARYTAGVIVIHLGTFDSRGNPGR